MTTTISHPSDPITNGASEIQGTVFAIVSADYTNIDPASARQYVQRKSLQKFAYFPTGKDIDPSWKFYIRKDMTGSSAGQRNLIGIRVVTQTVGIEAFSNDVGRMINVPVTVHRVESYNWVVALLTLTSTVIVPVWVLYHASYSLIEDPESGALLYGDGSHRSLMEAMGFLLTQVAANKPTNAPALNAVTGISPV